MKLSALEAVTTLYPYLKDTSNPPKYTLISHIGPQWVAPSATLKNVNLQRSTSEFGRYLHLSLNPVLTSIHINRDPTVTRGRIRFIDSKTNVDVTNAGAISNTQLMGYSGAFDCAITVSAGASDLTIHLFNYQNPGVITDKLTDTVTTGSLPADSVLTSSSTEYAIANGCANFRIAGTVWIRNNTASTLKYVKNDAASGATFTGATWD